MAERDATTDRHEAVGLCGIDGGRRHAGAIGGSPQQQRIAERLGGGEQEQLPALLWKSA
jgi:hypothetical protein